MFFKTAISSSLFEISAQNFPRLRKALPPEAYRKHGDADMRD